MNNVLIVDDSPITQKMLKMIFEEGGHSITATADNGKDAIKLYNENKDKIDIVTLDITMPAMDGLGVLKELLKSNPNAIIVMVSAIGKENVIKECLQIGAKNYITKPFKKEKILETVAYVTK